jgi:LPXTG-motif cell wall-anchored protein
MRRLTLGGILAVVALIAGAGRATAQADVIVIPVDTVVRGVPVGSLTELASAPVAPELVGATCTGDAIGRNNETSVHPGNDLIVTTGSSSAVLHDVEREPGVVTETVGELTLGEVITVTLRMGPDQTFSGGLVLSFDCQPPPPETTTTTAPPETTTTAPPETTTTAPPATTTTAPPETTTTPSTAPSTVPPTVAQSGGTPTTGAQLPATGVGSTGSLLAAGLVAVVAGTVLVLASRRRRTLG